MLHPHIVDGHSTSNVGIEDLVIGGENNRLSNSLDNKSSASSENLASKTIVKMLLQMDKMLHLRDIKHKFYVIR